MMLRLIALFLFLSIVFYAFLFLFEKERRKAIIWMSVKVMAAWAVAGILIALLVALQRAL